MGTASPITCAPNGPTALPYPEEMCENAPVMPGALSSSRIRGPSASGTTALLVIGIVVSAVIGLLVTRSSGLQVAIVVAAVPLAFAVVWASPRATIVGLAVWLVALGLLRRLLPGGSGTGIGDPLLLVGPAVLILLFLIAVGRGALRNRTPLANAVLLLSMLALVEAFNPLQGGTLVGLGGLLFVLVPMLAFWVGRTLLDDDLLRRLLWVIAVLSVIAAVYGLVQQFVGFPSWDERWINTAGYVALNVGGVIRSFGSFASSQEYATFLSIGIVAWVTLARRGRRTPLLVHVAVVALLFVTLVLASSRTELVLTVVALGIMLSARTGRRPLTMVVAGVLALVVLNLGAGYLFSGSTTPANPSTDPASVLVTHDLTGLANPGGSKSTLSSHVSRAVHGIKSAFTNPIGYGTGAITLASGKLGTTTSRGTEDDFGNAGVAFGLAGLILYTFIVLRGLLSSYRLAARRRDALSLAMLGLLTVVLGQWMNGDLYSVAWLVWLGLGWVDAKDIRRSHLTAVDVELMTASPVGALGFGTPG